MQLNSEALPKQLKSGLKSLYIVHGDALLLAIEAGDSIRAVARQQGYEERETFNVEGNFRWESILAANQSVSLFSPRKVIDIRIPSGKPGTDGSKTLLSYCQHLSPDILTLITLPRLDRNTQKSKWFSELCRHGVLVQADDISRQALPGWIAGRLKRQQQATDKDTLEFIAERCEGNLLAAFQEIQKLALLFPPGELSFEQVKDAVLDVARYDVFKLSEAMLSGNVARFSRILQGLQADGTASVLVLWAISEDIRTLGKVLQAMSSGMPLNQALKSARVWGSRQALIERSARRVQPAWVEQGMLQAAKIDKIIKGLSRGDEWDELLQLGLRFSHG